MIVLAIAGLILMIVFLAIPRVKAMSRDHAAKSFVGYTAQQLIQYQADSGGVTLSSVAQRCDFIQNYLTDYVGQGAACAYDAAKQCAYVHGKLYDVCFHDGPSSPHSYLGPVGEISIQTGHICNPLAGTSGDPITVSVGGESNFHYLVVWTALERVRMTCLSNR